MATFDLSKEVSALKLKMGSVTITIPEPSNHAVNTFQDKLANNLEAIGRPPVSDKTDMDEIRRAYSDLTVEEMDQLHDWSLDALVDLCNGSPSREQIDEMGHRGQQGFLGWVQEQLSAPNSRSATGSLRAV